MANQPKKYKKFVATAATATLVASAIVPVASADTIKFSDVKDDSEFAPFIYDLAEQGVMIGAKGEFNPTGQVTRNAAVKTLGKWLVNVHGYKVPEDYKTKERFSDLPVTYKDDELLKYAALVKDLGVFTGAAGKLNPTGTLTREQMAKVVVEAYSVVENRKVVDLVKDYKSSLTDIDKVAKDLVDYVKVFEKYKVTTVKTFNPKGKVQRQHFAKFLSLAINDEELKTDTKEKAPVIDPDKEPGQPEPEPIDYEKIKTDITNKVRPLLAVQVTSANAAEIQTQLDELLAEISKAEEIIAAATDLTDEKKAAYQADLALAKQLLGSVQTKIDAVKPGSVAEEVAAVEAAVAALPATVTEASADAAQAKVNAVNTAVAALEKAIAEAKNLPATDKAAAEKAVTDAKAAAAKTQAAIDAALAKVNVESVKATNATSVEVTFGKDQKLTEADLKDQVLKITDAEGKVIEATYRTSSLADGKATFDLPLNGKLVDAATYTAEFKGAKAEFVAKVTPAYAKKFTAVTTAVPATGTTPATKSVFFEAVDQYGEAIEVTAKTNLKVTVAYNGLPLVATEYSVDVTKGKLEVKIDESKRSLVKDGKLNIKVETYDKAITASDAKLIETSTASYTIIEAGKIVATTIAPIKATYKATVGNDQKVGAPATEVVPNNEINLSAEVKDQFGNPVDAASVRWVVTEGKDLISGDLAAGIFDTTAGQVSFKAEKPGKVTIEAYNVANGAKQTYTVEIGASKLTGIDVDTSGTIKQADGTTALVNATPYNKEEAIVAILDAKPSSALLKAEDVKFEVTTSTKDVTKDDLTVKAEKITVGTGANAKSYIVVKATSTKTASYTVTPYVGESLEKATIKGTAITVNSKANPTVTKIEVEEVKANELQAGKELVKAVKFFNTHGEQITVAADDLKAAGTSGVTTTLYKADNEGKQADEATGTEKVAFLGFNPSKAGAYTVTLITGSVSSSVSLSAVEAGKVQSLTLGGGTNVSVIAADSYDAKDKTDNIAVVGGKAYTLIPVSAKDNYGVDVALSSADLAIVNDSNIEVKYFEDLEGKEATGKNVKYIGIYAKATTSAPTKFEVGLKIDTVTGFVAPSKQITVTAARKADKATVAPTSVNLALGGTTTVKVNVVDQYGKPFNLTSVSDITITAPDFTISGEAQSKDAKDQAIVGQYEFKATAKSTGAKTIEVAVKDINTKSTVNVNVATASELVKSLVLSGKDIKDGVAVNKLKSTGDTTTISVVGKDASGAEVNVNPSEVIWTSSNPALATVSNGKVTVSSTLVTKDEQVTITADVFGVKQSVTFTISKDAPALVTGTFAVVDADKIDADSKTEGLQVYLDNDAKATDGEKDGAIELTFTGVDQYGDELTNLDVTAIAYNSTIASVEKLSGNKVKITSVKAGETTIRVTVGANEILIPIKVTEDAVKAIPQNN